MPDLTQVEEATGERLEKTDEYTRHRDAMKAHGFAVVHGFKADAMRDELLAALREEREKRRFWNHRNYQLVDKVRGQDWHLAYERAMREVVEKCWMYASRAEEAYDAGFLHGHSHRERQLYEAEQALAAVERERDRLRGAILTHVASAIGDPLETGQAYAAFLSRYQPADEDGR